MAGSAVQYLPRPLPVTNAFPVCTIYPVPGLIDMTLAADKVGIVELHLFTFKCDKATRTLQVVTGHTPELTLAMKAMLELKIIMGLFKNAWRYIALCPSVTIRTGVHFGIL